MVFAGVEVVADQKATDFGHLYDAKIHRSDYPKSIQNVQNSINYARQHNLKISIAGARHSQGGQSYATGSINLDLMNMNNVLKIDREKGLVTVQAGITWEQLQDMLHRFHLSVAVMQASNIFSVGGSLSVNVHGRDPSFGPIIETIESFKIVDCFGVVHQISRQKDPYLFSLVIGGYGLFGVVVEVTLHFVANCVCKKEQKSMGYEKYPNYLIGSVLNNLRMQLHYARLTTIPGKHFLKEIVAVNYTKAIPSKKDTPLLPEKNIEFNKKLLDLSRKLWGKIVAKVRWFFEEKITPPWEDVDVLTRNHVMRPYVQCLVSDSDAYIDLLQEYFIPLNYFVYFTDQLRAWAETNSIALLNVTLRWMPKNTESVLSYSTDDTIAFVLYFTIKNNDQQKAKIEKCSQDLITVALKTGGSFYLPYQRYATRSQLLQAYPRLSEFVQAKNQFDPLNLFVSDWYQKYILPAVC